MPTQYVNGIDIYYEISGQGDPVLYIHGLGSSTRDWEEQVTALQDRYQVITFDVRGHGQSAKPPGPYTVVTFAADAVGLLDALTVDSVHVAGISMGGMIGFQLAVDAPQRVKSLIAINAVETLKPTNFQDRIAILQRLAIARLLGMRRMGEFLAGRLFPKPEHESIREQFIDHWAENDVRAYNDPFKALTRWSVADRLDEIQCPVLIIASDQDYWPLTQKEALAARIPNAELVVVEDARHAVTAEYPVQINELLLSFLAQ